MSTTLTPSHVPRLQLRRRRADAGRDRLPRRQRLSGRSQSLAESPGSRASTSFSTTTARCQIIAHRSEMGTGVRTSLPMVARRRAQRRLVARPDPPGDRRHQVRLAEHRRLVLGEGLLRRHAHRRRQRADDARAGCGAARWKVPVGVSRLAITPSSMAPRNDRCRTASSSRPRLRCPCPIPSRCASSRRRSTRSSARPSPSRISTISSRAKARSGSTPDAGHGLRGSGTPARARQPGNAGRRCGGAESRRRAERGPPLEADATVRFKALGGAAVIADNSWAALQGRKALNVTGATAPTPRSIRSVRQQLLSTVQSAAEARCATSAMSTRRSRARHDA